MVTLLLPRLVRLLPDTLGHDSRSPIPNLLESPPMLTLDLDLSLSEAKTLDPDAHCTPFLNEYPVLPPKVVPVSGRMTWNWDRIELGPSFLCNGAQVRIGEHVQNLHFRAFRMMKGDSLEIQATLPQVL